MKTRALLMTLLASSSTLLGCGGSDVQTEDQTVGAVSAACSNRKPPPPPPPPTTLREAGARVDRLVGAAVEYGALTNDAAYAALAAQEFDYLTPGNETKWGSLQPSQDVWDFTQADAIFAFAHKHHMKVKGHTLVWHQQLPSWVNDSLTADQLDDALAAHIRKTVRRYMFRAHAWDVVNEAVADDGSGLRDTIFLQKLGSKFIEKAFKRAHNADPFAELYYNDYNTETINPKSDAVLAMVTDLVKHHVPIDGVGFQMHLDATSAPTKDQIKANFARFTKLGLSVNISELDIRVSKIPGSMARKLAFQKEVYNRVAAACVETKHCTAITSWGFTDAYSWIYAMWGPDAPLQFDGTYAKKPAYDGELLGLQDQLVPVPGIISNFVSNPSFESDTAGWDGWGSTLSQTTTAAHQGTKSLLVSNRTADWQGAVYALTGMLQAGFNYTASAWVQLATTDSVSLTAKIVCDGNTQYSPLTSAAGTPGQWLFLSGTLSIPQCTTLGEVDVYVSGAPAGVDLIVDDVFVGDETSSVGANLIANPGFENGAAGWTTWGATLSASTAQAHSGAHSGLVTDRTQTWQGAVYDLTAVILSGQQYSVTAWAMLGSGDAQNVNFTAKISCAGTDSYVQMASTPATSTGWTELTGSLTVPTCSSLTGFLVYLEGPSVGTDLYVDDVTLRQLARTNLIANPGFESGIAGWSTWGASISATTAQAHTGARSALVTSRTGTWQGAVYDLTSSVAMGQGYTASVWALVSGTDPQPVNFTAKITCDGTDSYVQIGTATGNSSTWTEITGTFTVPTCTTLGGVLVYAEGPAVGVDLYVDDATVE